MMIKPSGNRSVVGGARTETTRTPNQKRRNLLLTLGLGGAGAAAVAISTPLAGVNAQGAVEPAIADGEAGQGYQLTEHVRRYYRTAKI